MTPGDFLKEVVIPVFTGGFGGFVGSEVGFSRVPREWNLVEYWPARRKPEKEHFCSLFPFLLSIVDVCRREEAPAPRETARSSARRGPGFT